MNESTGTKALVRSLSLSELNEVYRLAKTDETGQHAARIFGREIIRRAIATCGKRTKAKMAKL